MQSTWVRAICGFTSIITGCALGVFVPGASAQVVAHDTADDPAYNSGWDLSANGGFGYLAWTEFGGGGGRYLDDNRHVDGARSFALWPGDSPGSSYSVARPLATAMDFGVFTALARHDLNSETGFSGFQLHSSFGASVGDGMLVRFGLPGDAVSGSPFGTVMVEGADGPKFLSPNTDGEVRGDILLYSLAFDLAAGTYEFSVTNMSDGGFDSVMGTLATGVDVVGATFTNQNYGSFQNFIFDNPTFIIPEPATLSLLALGGLSLLRRRR